MRNSKLFVIGIALLAAGALYAGQAQAESIVNSVHNLSSVSGNTIIGTSDQVCIYCHTPHNALSTLVPLWNHPTTSATTFTPYTSVTLNATIDNTLAGTSKACLSCHDGSIAADSYAGVAGDQAITGAALLDTDLSNDHPIGFTYDTDLVTADGGEGLNDPGALTNVVLFSGQVQCATCHNVHDPQYGNFLRASNTSSALCLECHIK